VGIERTQKQKGERRWSATNNCVIVLTAKTQRYRMDKRTMEPKRGLEREMPLASAETFFYFS
jgi:hypothetical protein